MTSPTSTDPGGARSADHAPVARPAGVIGGLPEALHATAPHRDRADRLQLFGQFVGSWHLEWSKPGHDPMSGELHVGWVLGGRAVQDVWIVPGRGRPGEGEPPLAFHGSTIRFHDPSVDAWRSTWIEPVNGRVRRFLGRPAGSEILLLSDEDDPQLRWRFTDIRAESFRWVAEISHDGGASWEFDEEMRATRRAPRHADAAEPLDQDDRR